MHLRQRAPEHVLKAVGAHEGEADGPLSCIVRQVNLLRLQEQRDYGLFSIDQ